MSARVTWRICLVLLGLTGCRSSQTPTGGTGEPPPKGVLAFRILADKSKTEDVDKVDACRAAFAKAGPTPAGMEEGYGWFRIKDPASFFRTKDVNGEFERVQKDTPVVVERRGDECYLLAHTGAEYVMTLAAGAPAWAVQSARVNRSTHGYAGIEVQLDDRGGALLEKLTQAHKDRLLGIFLDDKAISHATIKDVLRQKVLIAGSYAASEADNIVKLILEASGQPKP
jgi:hypothetical protein